MTSETRRRILWSLVAVHVVLGIVTARLVTPPSDLLLFVFFAIFISDAGLLGLWAGLAPLSPLYLAGVAVGLIYLWLLPFFAMQNPLPKDIAPIILLLVACFAVPAFIAAILFRHITPRLRLVLVTRLAHDPSRVQISIRFLFGLTAAIAVLITLYKVLGTITGTLTSEGSMVAFLILLGLSAGWIPWFAASATLVPRKPLLPTLMAILACSLVGAIPPWFLGEPMAAAWPPLVWLSFIGIAATQATIVMASLLIVRWCGYRLVPAEAAERDGGPAEVGNG